MASVSGKVDPVVRRITAADIAEALTLGLRDFQARPLYGLTFGLIYVLGGITILLCLTAFGMVYLVYPLAAGFALIGPFVAIGLYEVSRRRELGQPLSFGALWSTIISRGEIGWMAFVTLFFFIIWMYQVRLLIALLLGLNASFSSIKEFITVILTTNEGLLFLVDRQSRWRGAVLDPVLADGGVVSAVARARGGFRHRDGHERARSGDESGADDRLGRCHRGAADRLRAALLRRTDRDFADPGARDLASVPAHRGAGGELTLRLSPLRKQGPITTGFSRCARCA